MYLSHEDENGVIMEYRSNRLGFSHYLIGESKLLDKN